MTDRVPQPIYWTDAFRVGNAIFYDVLRRETALYLSKREFASVADAVAEAERIGARAYEAFPEHYLRYTFIRWPTSEVIEAKVDLEAGDAVPDGYIALTK